MNPVNDNRPSTRRIATALVAGASVIALCVLGCETTPEATEPAPMAVDAPALLNTTAPPAARRLLSNDGQYIVVYRTRPEPIPTSERFTVEAWILDATRGEALIRDAELFLDAAMPEHRHGMNVVPTVRKQNDGSYVGSGMLFHMPGRWELYFDITRGLVTERAQDEVWLD